MEKYGYNPDEEEIEGNDELDLLTERYEELCKELSIFRMNNREISKKTWIYSTSISGCIFNS